MANSRSTGDFKEYATIDTQPSGTDLGYWTNEVCLRDKQNSGLAKDKMWFSIREFEADSSEASDTSSMTVTLQFKCDGDAGWQDYVDFAGSTLARGNRLVIEDTGAGARYRAGVKDGDFTSGKVTVGFDW
jgi:hypothetical protein